jgi:flagellar biosynthetic protein FliR
MDDFRSILAHVPGAMLVVFRVGGLAITAPLFSSPSVPVRVRVMLAAAVGLAVYPALVGQGVVAPGGLRLELFALVPLVAAELAIGLVLGFLVAAPLVAAQTSGLLMGQQMGLGFAQFYNPDLDEESDVVGQALFLLALAGFLAMGGHEATVGAIMHSFDRVPLGGFAVDRGVVDIAGGMLVSALELALRVAAPLLVLVFLESVAMGFMAKTVPQLNVLSLGFPLRILAGLATVIVTLHVIGDVLGDAITDVVDVILAWIDGRGASGGVHGAEGLHG